MTDSWIERPAGLRGMPAGLARTDRVEFRLPGDGSVYEDQAGNLSWGDGPGAIAGYRRVTLVAATEVAQRHRHYFKDVKHLAELDVYRVLALFNVADPALAHAVKKLLVAGGRGAGKDSERDVQEAIDSLVRWQEMRGEDRRAAGVA